MMFANQCDLLEYCNPKFSGKGTASVLVLTFGETGKIPDWLPTYLAADIMRMESKQNGKTDCREACATLIELHKL